MTPRSASLEHRLRRWLRLYPIDQREEMLGVLLATAGPGQERPSPRDAADLVGGAVRVRLQREIRSLGGPVWRDAFAVLSLVTTLVLFTGTVDALRSYEGWYVLVEAPPAPIWPMWVPWPVVAALSLLGLRRTAIGLAWMATLSQLPWLAIGQDDAFSVTRLNDNLFWLELAVVAAGALSISDGLRRALSLLGTWRAAVLLLGIGVVTYVLTGVPDGGAVKNGTHGVMLASRSIHDRRWLLTIAALVLIAIACARLRTAAGRRWAAMLALSLAPLVCSMSLWLVVMYPLSGAIGTLRLIAPLFILAIIAVAAISRLRGRRRSTS
ncbi:hypothetical protein [Actinoallomurus sp. CA-150999]|uniref:hypothetical protein n=1 Tax=Actinoallomurus sp. CA-150999 TaxID=3239887 RepID=UPI003D91C5DA